MSIKLLIYFNRLQIVTNLIEKSNKSIQIINIKSNNNSLKMYKINTNITTTLYLSVYAYINMHVHKYILTWAHGPSDRNVKLIYFVFFQTVPNLTNAEILRFMPHLKDLRTAALVFYCCVKLMNMQIQTADVWILNTADIIHGPECQCLFKDAAAFANDN